MALEFDKDDFIDVVELSILENTTIVSTIREHATRAAK